MTEVLDGKVLKAVAHVECGACGKEFRVVLDPAEGPTVYDAMVAAIIGFPLQNGATIQGGYILCRRCTNRVDNSPTVPEDRWATREEVREVLDID